MDEQKRIEQEQLKEERAIQKEEKRREAEQNRLKTEREARIAAVRSTIDALFHKAAVGKRTVASESKSLSVSFRKQLRKGKVFAEKTVLLFDKLFEKLWRFFTSFAEKPLSIPIFIIAAFFSYAGIAYLFGYTIGRLEANIFTFQFYLCDYSVGVCSLLFVGAVIALFTDYVPLSLINQIVNCSVILTMAGQAVPAGLLLRSGLKNRSVPAALLGLLFMTNPLMMLDKLYLTGMLDIYLVLLLLLWLAFLKTPLLPLVTPFFCVAGMAIHYQFLISHLPPMLALLFFYALFSEDKRKRVINASALITGSVASGTSLVYFTFFAKRHLKMTPDEFFLHTAVRFGFISPHQKVDLSKTLIPIYRDYLDYHLFGIDHGEKYSVDVKTFINHLMQFTGERINVPMLRKDIMMFIPVFLLVAIIWIWCAKREKGVRKLPYLCFVAQALVLLPELLISTDVWRWFAGAMIAQFVVFSILYLDKETTLHQLIDKSCKRPSLGGCAFLSAFAFIGFTLTLK